MVQFFLTEIVARIAAAYIGYDCLRTIRRALAEGRIRLHNSDWLDWLINWSPRVVSREREPYSFWFQVGGQALAMVACVFVVLFGWFRVGG